MQVFGLAPEEWMCGTGGGVEPEDDWHLHMFIYAAGTYNLMV